MEGVRSRPTIPLNQAQSLGKALTVTDVDSDVGFDIELDIDGRSLPRPLLSRIGVLDLLRSLIDIRRPLGLSDRFDREMAPETFKSSDELLSSLIFVSEKLETGDLDFEKDFADRCNLLLNLEIEQTRLAVRTTNGMMNVS